MLIPTWFLLAVWVAAAGATALGYVTNDLAAPGLIGGLVLIVMLIGFTIMQSAFSGGEAAGDVGGDGERRALAMTGCGEAIFDWNVVTDEINVSETWKPNSASSAARSRDRPPAGSTCCIRSIATAMRLRSTGSCTSAPAGSITNSGCAAPTATISGTC